MPYIQADETPVIVLKDAKKNLKMPHIKAICGFTVILQGVFTPMKIHERDSPERQLAEFQGYVQTDAYAGYNGLFMKGSKPFSRLLGTC